MLRCFRISFVKKYIPPVRGGVVRCFNERFSLMFVLFPVLRQERLQGVEREGVPIRKGMTAEQSSPCVLVLRTVYRKSITS